MKLALVCDWLTTPGGAEKVLLELHKMYPDAPIYTSQYRKKGINWFDNADVRTGWLQIFPACFRKLLGPLRQIYFSRLDLSSYDLVISVTGAEAKSVRTAPKNPNQSKSAYHLCYCHVPTQYYWQMYDAYLHNPGFGFINPIVRLLLKLLIKPLREADFRASQRPDQFVTISSYAAAQIQKYYHRDPVIIAPPVAVDRFRPQSPPSSDFHRFSTKPANNSTTNPQVSTAFPPKPQKTPHLFHKIRNLFHQKSTKPSELSTSSPQSTPATLDNHNHFIIACRQATWKRIDLAIKACLATSRPLTVIGDGSEHARLVQLAKGSPLITFVPWLDSASLARYLQTSCAYLFPSLEPFGIAAVEALAAGCPVIAYAEGGSRDIVLPGKNGLLFDSQTVESLSAAIRRFHPQNFDRATITKSADRFSSGEFRNAISELISTHLSSPIPSSHPHESHLNHNHQEQNKSHA